MESNNEATIEIQARLIEGYVHLAGVVSKMLDAETLSATDRANLKFVLGIRVNELIATIDKAAPNRGQSDRLLRTYTNPTTSRS